MVKVARLGYDGFTPGITTRFRSEMGSRVQRLPILFASISVARSSLAACPRHNATGVHRTRLPRNLFPANEQREGGDAADVVACAEFLSLLGI